MPNFPSLSELKEDTLDKIANDWAEYIKQENKISSSQLRKFYGEVKSIQRELIQGKKWSDLVPIFKLLKAKVLYNQNRKSNKIPKQFSEFMIKGINSVNVDKEFTNFCLFFEAVVGYLYGNGGVSQ